MKSFRKKLRENQYGCIHGSIHAPYSFDESLIEAISTPDEIKAHLEQARSLTQHYSGLLTNSKQKNAIKSYTKDSYPLNHQLWKNSPHNQDKENLFGGAGNTQRADLKEVTKHLDKALDSYRTPHDLTVWSSTTHDPRVEKGSSDYVHHPAFLSTSIYKPVAMDRDINSHRDNQGDTHHHILQIHVPKGSPGAYIDHVSHNPGEKEFLLPRGLNLRYHKTDSTHKVMRDYYSNNLVKKHTHIHYLSVEPTE